MPELSSAMVALLVVLAFAAGFVSSMAGAGGLITLPALLWAGLPPLLVHNINNRDRFQVIKKPLKCCKIVCGRFQV